MKKDIFEFHKLNEGGIEKAKEIKEIFLSTLKKLNTMMPDGREFSIVQTKLEEACFFAKKGMAIQKENQE